MWQDELPQAVPAPNQAACRHSLRQLRSERIFRCATRSLAAAWRQGGGSVTQMTHFGAQKPFDYAHVSCNYGPAMCNSWQLGGNHVHLYFFHAQVGGKEGSRACN